MSKDRRVSSWYSAWPSRLAQVAKVFIIYFCLQWNNAVVDHFAKFKTLQNNLEKEHLDHFQHCCSSLIFYILIFCFSTVTKPKQSVKVMTTYWMFLILLVIFFLNIELKKKTRIKNKRKDHFFPCLKRIQYKYVCTHFGSHQKREYSS